MKTVLAAMLLWSAHFIQVECIPTHYPDAEIMFVPVESGPEDRERESSSFLIPITFSRISQQLEAAMAALANRIKGLTNISDWGEATNSTSTKKVVDGHIVTVNESTYNDNGALMFVRVIDVKPTEQPPKGSPESEGKSKSQSAEQMGKESDEGNSENHEGQMEDFTSNENNFEHAQQVEKRQYYRPDSYVDNAIDVLDSKPIDLESDIYINKLKDENRKGGLFMVPSDVEIFDIQNGKPVHPYNPYMHRRFRERTQPIFV